VSLLRLLGPQGIAGLAASLCLALLLVLQKAEIRHWRKQSGQFEQLYHREQAAHRGTELNFRGAADAARAADRANADRVRSQQAGINERTSNDLQKRLAAARAHAEQLRGRQPPQPIPVVAKQRQCPPYPRPPANLMKPPLKSDFLSATAWSRPSRRSSSTS
jgi:hypothetical protein